MSVLDNLSRWVRRRFGTSTAVEPPKYAYEMASDAMGEGVTASRLANEAGVTNRPILEYLEDGEVPEYVLSGTKLIISGEEDYTTEYPTRETQVVVTDRRVLIILGGHLSDNSWEVPFTAVLDIYLDDVGWHEYVIVDAEREGEAMTFFVDCAVDDIGDMADTVTYVREQADISAAAGD